MKISKENHLRAILEFYKAGYITTIKKDRLIANLYKSYKTNIPIHLSTIDDGRELIYFYMYYKVKLTVNNDFYVIYNVEKRTFTECVTN